MKDLVKILTEFIGFPVEESKEKAVTDSGEMWMFRYHFQEQIAEVIKVILQQWVSERIVEQIVEAVPQIWREREVVRPTVQLGSFQQDWRRWRGFFLRRFTPFFALLQVV